jgi:HSP20 family molecular chaperone IbpA
VRREIAFPEDVIAEKTEATVKDEVLEVRLPKKVPSETKTHKV